MAAKGMYASLPPAEEAWVRNQAKERKVSLSEVFRQLVAQAMSCGNQLALSSQVYYGSEHVVKLKAAVVDGVTRHYNLVPVAKEIGVSRRTIYNWLADDPEFEEAVDAAREQKINSVEAHLVKIAMGEKDPETGHPIPANQARVTALLAVLNAHHPAYGQPRAAILARLMQPIIDRVREIAARHLPPDALRSLGAELCGAVDAGALKADPGAVLRG